MPAIKKSKQSEPKIVGKFRILAGGYFERGTKYKQGDIVESVSDLLKFNSPGAVKFARLDGTEQVFAETAKPEPNTAIDELSDLTSEELEELTLDELRGFAEEADVDLAGCGNNKAKIIERLKSEN